MHTSTHRRLSKGLEVGESISEEKRAKMSTMTTTWIIQPAYHGYHPAPTGRAPKSTDTIPIMIAYGCKNKQKKQINKKCINYVQVIALRKKLVLET